MHYYQFNIGDYAKSTSHLSALEDLAYRRLLDRYYDTEKPLEADLTQLCRFIRMGSYETETQQILDEFFSLTQKGWIQKRVQRELGVYSSRAESARANGKLGGRPKKTQPVNLANPELTQPKAKQEPLTNNHKPITTKEIKGFKPPSLDEIKDYILNKTGRLDESLSNNFFNHYESNGWKVGRNPMKSWNAAINQWLSRGKNNGTNKQPNHKPSLVERARQGRREREAKREAEYQANGTAMGSISGDLRPSVCEPVRDGTSGQLGETFDGTFTQSN